MISVWNYNDISERIAFLTAIYQPFDPRLTVRFGNRIRLMDRGILWPVSSR